MLQLECFLPHASGLGQSYPQSLRPFCNLSKPGGVRQSVDPCRSATQRRALAWALSGTRRYAYEAFALDRSQEYFSNCLSSVLVETTAVSQPWFPTISSHHRLWETLQPLGRCFTQPSSQQRSLRAKTHFRRAVARRVLGKAEEARPGPSSCGAFAWGFRGWLLLLRPDHLMLSSLRPMRPTGNLKQSLLRWHSSGVQATRASTAFQQILPPSELPRGAEAIKSLAPNLDSPP